MFIFQLIDLSPGSPKAMLVNIHLFTKQPFSIRPLRIVFLYSEIKENRTVSEIFQHSEHMVPHSELKWLLHKGY